MFTVLGVLLLAVFASAFAGLRDGSWEVNPASFRYDMSLYFKLVDKDFEDLGKYEIGAFVGDECRGLAEKLVLSEDESCLYMRIRSNESSGEALDFLLRNKETGDTVIVKPADGSDFIFKSGSRVGMPSAPFVMTRFYNVTVSTEGKGSVEFTDGLYAAGTELNLKAVPDTGYHFVGWSNGTSDEAISLTVNENLDLIASFSPNIYKATFIIDNDVKPFEEVIDVACGDTIVAPRVPVIEGLTFSGWNDLPEVMPAHDIVATGSYEIGVYKIVFKVDGEVVEEAELEFGKPINIPTVPAKEGYVFNGWDNVPSTMPSHDVEIHSSYTLQSYLLTFKLENETILSENVAFGTSIVAPEAPAKEGYSFSGWNGLPETMPAAPLTVTGSYTVNSYNLVFKIDGVEVSAEKVEYGAPVAAPKTEEKTGYTFNGWGELPATMPAHDVEMHASYTANSYKLTFNLDGTILQSDELTYGSSVVAPEVAAKEGYSFSGWDKEVPATMPAEDLVISGKYDINSYKVTYKIDGEVAQESEVAYGAAVPTYSAPAKDGYAFVGWSASDIPSFMPAKDLEFNGSYIVNEFDLTFKIGDEIISSNRVVFGSEITSPEAPAKEGYTFSGWGNVPATMPQQDVVIEGSYTINRYKVTYIIEDKEYLTQEYEFGAPIEAPAEPTEEGHSFSGWGDIPATMPAFDLTFGGTFAENFYRLTFRLDGIVIYTDDVVYGTAFSAPEVPEKEGHTFNGWGDIPTAMPAYNLEYDGTYTVNNYPISFKIGDSVIYQGELPYGASIEAPAAPLYEGHTFGGWGLVPNSMPASELEITGEYTVNSYNLIFRIGDEDFYTTQVKYGEAITAPEAPEKIGHSFSGWSELPAAMPASDLIVTGAYTVNNYALSFKIDNEEIFKGDIPYGMEISAPEAPLKEGHTFAGWGMVPNTMPASDLEVIGTYNVNVYNLSYLIDGNSFYSTQIAYGSAINAPEAPAKEGHSFLGWSDAVATMPAGDLVISGSYAVNNYNIEFKIGDDSIYKGEIPYGTAIVAPEAPYKEGHTFDGWGMVPATMPASDLAFDGSYTVNIYKLIFDIDGEDFYTTQLAYGTEIVAPAEVPDKEGHSFEGWGNVPATMPANDIEISGTYSANHYTLTFKIGDEVYFTGEQPYGSVIKEPNTPVKEGYTFAGWEKYPETVPAENVEVNGSFSINQYKVEFVIKDYDANGDKVVASEVLDYGKPITIPDIDNTKTGYTFSGFGVVPATVPASDVVYTGEFVVNYYTLTFKNGEEVIVSAQVPYGAKIEVPSKPEKEGYVFTGWGNVPAVMPAKDLEFQASYAINSYELTFRVDGVRISSKDLEYGAPIEVPEVAEKEGHTFTGWGVVPPTMPASDLEITGKYEKNTYNVVFKIGDEVLESLQVLYGDKFTAPAAPEKEGYTFNGWKDVPAAMPANDLEFNSSYTVNTYKVTFKIDGEVVSSSEVEFGELISVYYPDAREGYTFSGWGIIPLSMPASDVEFNGTFDVNSYNIIFKINSDIVYSAQIPYGSEIVAPAAPSEAGYTFSGWSEYPSTMPAQDVEVTATYTTNVYKAIFKIGDEVIETIDIPYGEAIKAPEAPEKEGYTFDGWKELPETMPAEDITVEGSYTVNVYKAVFTIDGEEFKVVEVAYGEAIETPEAPEKEGMTFSGWKNVPETMPARDITVEGNYTANVYKVVFVIDGEEYKVIEVAYGEPIEAPAAPEKEGLTFSGWKNLPETMPAEDITVEGSFTINYYKVIFSIDGEEFKSIEVAVGSVIVAPEAPEKEGYTFTGWENLPETMPARDIEINGAYEVNYYRLIVYLNDQVYIDEEIAYGDEIVVPDPKVEEGMKFDGWQEVIPATMPAHDVEIHGTVSEEEQSGVFGVKAGETITVYTVDGVLLYKNIKVSDIKERLTPGIYIVNGKKTVIR